MKRLKTTISMALFAFSACASAVTVDVEMTAQEINLVIDNAGHEQAMWAYDGEIPGPLVRVKEGDVVNFTLHNAKENKQSHSMDFHAAQLDVLDEFASIKPGGTKNFQFEAKVPGVFIYHCGSEAMSEHISKGLYGVIIVDPKEGYSDKFPKPDREYVLVQGDLFEEGTEPKDITMNKGWKGALINGKQFHYDPVHDSNASLVLDSFPGERVRIYFVNAMINEAVAFHPIAGIWDRVWESGNPDNIRYGMQTVEVPPADAMILDIVSPEDRSTNNALVDHRMKHALNGAITVLMNNKDASPTNGKDGNLILR